MIIWDITKINFQLGPKSFLIGNGGKAADEYTYSLIQRYNYINYYLTHYVYESAVSF